MFQAAVFIFSFHLYKSTRRKKKRTSQAEKSVEKLYFKREREEGEVVSARKERESVALRGHARINTCGMREP